MKISNLVRKGILVMLSLVMITSCENEESIKPVEIFGGEESNDPLDIYLKEEFRDPYGSVIIYKFVDRYIAANRFAVPPRRDVVKPVAELIKQAWINPYIKASDQGEGFLKKYFPAEIVLLGSPLYNGDGTITLGVADAGVRVTLTEVNNYSEGDTQWILRAFRTLHHEFAHIIDQNFNFDVEAFYEISGSDYTSPGTWTIETFSSAIERGMVTPYGTSSVGEDFAELISYIITTDPDEFEAIYLTPEECNGDPECLKRNEGRKRIQQKYDVVVKYLKEDVGIDLLILRDEFLKTIN